jgi:hypothetical protein
MDNSYITTGQHDIDADLNIQNPNAVNQGPTTTYICGSCGKDV